MRVRSRSLAVLNNLLVAQPETLAMGPGNHAECLHPFESLCGSLDLLNGSGQQTLRESGSPVFDLLGRSGKFAGQNPVETFESGNADVDGASFMNTLHERYCDALLSPLEAPRDGWVGSTTVQSETGSGADVWEGGPDTPIAAFLGDINTMEQAFGAFRDVESPHLREDIPEVLSLFAPPEQQALASLRDTHALPPELARREHHMLSLDSPMQSMEHLRGDVLSQAFEPF
jgi:hypothetical protein